MRELAKHLQSQGRGEDSVLIHMTPGEVKGLQALAMAHGGSLTINPVTGLPEAGFLGKILPMVLGVAGAFVGIPPMLTAALVGGGTGLATGSLGKGLMAGLGAFGGASLGASLGAGAASGNGPLSGMGGKLGNLFGGGSSAATVTPTAVPIADPPASTLPNWGQKFLGAAKGIENPADMAKLGFGDIGYRGGAAALGLAAPFLQPEPTKMPKEDKYNPMASYKPLPPRKVSYPGAGGDSSEHMYFTPSNYAYASGGGVERNYGFKAPAGTPIPPEVKARLGFMGKGGRRSGVDSDQLERQAINPHLMQLLTRPRGGFRDGGEVRLKDGSFVLDARTVSEIGNGSSGAGQERLARVGGQPIRGPGDGVSDSIRANIGGRQPARVARDEVYMPPDAVRRIGRGDNKRGAAKLYSLMDRAHHERRKAKRGEPSKGLGALLK